MAMVLMKHPLFLMNHLDNYNTAVYPWNSHWGGRKPTALFTYYFSLRMWWLMANVAYNARQSACVETELVSRWVELHTIRLAQSWWYIFTYWPESATLCRGFGVTDRKKKKKKHYKKPSHKSRSCASIILYFVKNRTMQKSVSLLV